MFKKHVDRLSIETTLNTQFVTKDQQYRKNDHKLSNIWSRTGYRRKWHFTSSNVMNLQWNMNITQTLTVLYYKHKQVYSASHQCLRSFNFVASYSNFRFYGLLFKICLWIRVFEILFIFYCYPIITVFS